MDAIPTLSPEGFTTNKTIMMTKLYEHFLCSEYSQSVTFVGDIASLKYILSEAANSVELKDMCTEALIKMFSKYYAEVIVDVIIEDTDSAMKISINISTLDAAGNTYKLSELIDTTNNIIKNFDSIQETYHV